MMGKHDEHRKHLDRLGERLARDVEEMSDEALFREAEEHFGDASRAVADSRRLIDDAIAAHGKSRLAAAREGYDYAVGRNGDSPILRLPLDTKRALIERFAGNDAALREKLTMAARNERDHEADLDTFLEDLVELGVVDEEGNEL